MSEIWDRFVSLAGELDRLRLTVLSNNGSAAELVQQAINDPAQRGAAFELINHLSVEERQALFPSLVDLACFFNKYQRDAFLVICALPRKWVVENIASHAAQILKRAGEEEFGLLLHLLFEVNPQFGTDVARKGLDNQDESIKHIAATFLCTSR